jgi:hypothetical protein
VLGSPEATVRVQRLRAVRKLRDKWVELYGSEGMVP